MTHAGTVTLTLLAVLLSACAESRQDSAMSGSGGQGGNSGTGGTSSSAGMVGTGGSASTGGSAGATGSGGSTGSGGVAPSPVIPTASGTTYRFSFDGYVFEVDAAKGGRVTTFSIDGKNILSGPAANPENYGSTFWPSPQSAWGWPPPAEIDPGAYAPTIDGDTLVLQSQPSAKVNLSITKRIVVDRSSQSVTVAYEMKNTGTTAATWAPWEITRVPAGGLTYFALGGGGTAAVAPWTPTPLQEEAGWRWFDDAALQIADNKGRKTFADGKGWIAHVARAERLLLVKTFADVQPNAQAKDEAEIEIFVDSARKYVEVENQGDAQVLGPGATRAWKVRWSLRALPANVGLAVGSAALIDATKALVVPQ